MLQRHALPTATKQLPVFGLGGNSQPTIPRYMLPTGVRMERERARCRLSAVIQYISSIARQKRRGECGSDPLISSAEVLPEHEKRERGCFPSNGLAMVTTMPQLEHRGYARQMVKRTAKQCNAQSNKAWSNNTGINTNRKHQTVRAT